MSRVSRKALTFCMLFAASSVAARADLINNWNLVTTGNFYSHSSTEIDGNVRIGGAMSVDKYNVGIHLGSPYRSQDTLVVGGSVTGEVRVQTGNAQIGGAGAQVTAVDGTTGVHTNVGAVQNIGVQDALELKADSQAFAAMATLAANVATLPSGQPSGALFTVAAVDANKIAVFNINGADLFSSKTQQIDLKLANGMTESSVGTVVINVTGASFSMNNGMGNFVGFFTSDWARSHVIWNFTDATSLDFTNHEFDGAILAYQASLQSGSAPIQGSVFVKEFLGPNGVGQTGEIHLPLFKGFDPASHPAVPEPASVTMLGLAAAAGAAWRLKRLRAA
ncbi:choice-of-anchor A family protein [Paludisphaera mucosa]|uniref:Choice-of-anchor A family protein n=1 Tax=Paludisphaera mucosa TaxID=3030827 RepID=A0ABT6FFP2_9BACT|nr:choice-of-anchor A family protein [Paludisphaera mucosa]MDG3006344.1 choice-of-anchor A family protein [Paludisphaera mucosa]